MAQSDDGTLDVQKRRIFYALAAVFLISRLAAWKMGVRFDAEPLDSYWQFIDPALLQHDFWRSLFYLEQQPPAFNFFLGAILHLAPGHAALAFQAIYLCLGLALPLSLFALMDRMHVDRRIAFILAVFFTLSPSTLLYENLLFYEYPLMTLLCVAALFLHRYAIGGRFRDGVVFFSCLVLISGMRSVYPLLWFLTAAAFLAWVRRAPGRTLLAAAIPGVFLAAFYAKEAIVFHRLVPGGGVYGAANLSTMVLWFLPPKALDPLVASREISPILKTDIFALGRDFDGVVEEQSLAKIVPAPARTGIPVLDDCTKSTGFTNWNCTWLDDLAKVYARDSLVVMRQYPAAYLRSVLANVPEYFLPDTEGWPFDGRSDDPNERILSGPLAVSNLLTSGEWRDRINRPWLSYVMFPGLLAFGVFKVIRWRSSGDAASASTLAFMIGNTIYLSVVVVLFSEADQNRYRSEVSPYYALMLGLFLTWILRRAAQNRERSPSGS